MLRLEELRKNKGISQDTLAQDLNMTQQRISAYEKGKREPDIETIKQFAEYFDVSTDYLLGKSDIRNPEKIDEDKLNVAFNSGFDGLNETNKQIAISNVQLLLAKQKLDEEKKEGKK